MTSIAIMMTKSECGLQREREP